MTEYTESGCINLVGAAFKVGLRKTSDINKIKTNIKFVQDGDLFKLWCLITGQDEDRLRKLTVVRNHSFIIDIKNGDSNKRAPVHPLAS